MLLLSFGSLVVALASGLSILAREDETVEEAVEEAVSIDSSPDSSDD
jgi:hypothetical protein